jgi:hypothetical protein
MFDYYLGNGCGHLALRSFKNNPSIVGFAIGQMIISRIVSVSDMSIPPLMSFTGNVVALSMNKPSTHYLHPQD